MRTGRPKPQLRGAEPEYCIYTDRRWPSQEMSVEHIIPQAIGGCQSFSIRVNCRENGRLGTTVDAPVVDWDTFKLFRLTHRIKGKDGKIPTLRLRHVTIDGETLKQVELVVGPDGAGFRPIREIERIGNDGYLISVTDLRDYERLKKEIEAGRPGIKLVNLDSDEHVIPPGAPSAISTVHGEALLKFFAKVALAGTYRLAGPSFATSKYSLALRTIVQTGNAATRERALVDHVVFAAGGEGKPNAEDRFRHHRDFPSEHLFVLECHDSGMRAWIGLFGYVAARFEVSAIHLGVPGADRRGLIVLLNWKTRRTRHVQLGHIEGTLGASIERIMEAC